MGLCCVASVMTGCMGTDIESFIRRCAVFSEHLYPRVLGSEKWLAVESSKDVSS